MKALTKSIAILSMAAVVVCCAPNIAYAHGHHHGRARTARTTQPVIEYATCYANGYCDGGGSCDVDGVCIYGGICSGSYCYADGSCDVDGVCVNGVDCDGTAHHSYSYSTGYGHHH